ncbi:MAG: sulfite exporter TauE/SafE family protein [Proteobacteria bacterium]|nr:sulfite exporter TauE/SafE family protein [Pseudomonadota bacterium]
MSADLTPATLAVLWLGAFVGALAAGGAGFAFALAASAIWLHVLTPIQTTLLVVACGTFLHLGLIWPLRKSIEAARLWPFLLGAVLGVPLGVWLLTRIEVNVVKFTLGAVLAVYGAYALAAPRLPRAARGGRTTDALVGFLGGILGGLGGYSGVLPAIWTQLRGWPKNIARGVYQPFILAAHIATLLLVGTVAMDRATLMLIALALPPLLAGAWVGWRIYGQLDERRFRQVLAAALVISGLALMF